MKIKKQLFEAQRIVCMWSIRSFMLSLPSESVKPVFCPIAAQQKAHIISLLSCTMHILIAMLCS